MLEGTFSLVVVCQPARSMSRAAWSVACDLRLISSRWACIAWALASGNHKSSTLSLAGPDSAEQVGVLIALVRRLRGLEPLRAHWRTWPFLLPEPGFILKP